MFVCLIVLCLVLLFNQAASIPLWNNLVTVLLAEKAFGILLGLQYQQDIA